MGDGEARPSIVEGWDGGGRQPYCILDGGGEVDTSETVYLVWGWWWRGPTPTYHLGDSRPFPLNIGAGGGLQCTLSCRFAVK